MAKGTSVVLRLKKLNNLPDTRDRPPQQGAWRPTCVPEHNAPSSRFLSSPSAEGSRTLFPRPLFLEALSH